jgi:predicted dehydrogenase
MMTNRHVLVVGAGSVGKRHLRNLSALGCRVSAIDPRADRLEEAAGEIRLEDSFPDLEAALRKPGGYSGAVVASPPKYHVPQCIALAAEGIPILLEKPVARSLGESMELEMAIGKMRGAKLLLGYSYRWWPPLNAFRSRILSGEIGRPLHAKFVMSAHLADWHPWERYQDFFMASKELGGGALLDESHFVDLMIFFFGMPKSVFAIVERIGGLAIDTDDNVDIIASYENGPRVVVHLDLFGRPHEKYISVTGETGTLVWSFEPNRIRLGREMGQDWTDTEFRYERNDMFVETAKEFLEMSEGRGVVRCTLRDGIDVLRVIEACRESSASGRAVPVGESCPRLGEGK